MALMLWRSLGILRHLSGARSWIRSRSFETEQDLKTAFFQELGRRANIDTQKAKKWYEERFIKSFIKMLAGPAQVRPGLLELLSRLKGRGIRLAVVSDYGYVDDRLEALGIPLNMFDDTYSAEYFGALKPSPLPLNALARKWEVEPEDLIVVGDRADLDAESVRAAGMHFLGISGGKSTQSNGEAFLSWQEAVKLLDARTGGEDETRRG
jgi:FMN phosphatase YigB (HAD superfamily)